MAKVEVVSSEKERKTNYVAIAAVIIFVIIMFFSVINSLFNFTSNIANMDNLSGCYYIDDVLTADVSLCFDGSSVDYTNWGTTVTLNVDKIDNSVYITNEYDDYIFTCDISNQNSNRMQCNSYSAALGSGKFYFEKE